MIMEKKNKIYNFLMLGLGIIIIGLLVYAATYFIYLKDKNVQNETLEQTIELDGEIIEIEVEKI